MNTRDFGKYISNGLLYFLVDMAAELTVSIGYYFAWLLTPLENILVEPSAVNATKHFKRIGYLIILDRDKII